MKETNQESNKSCKVNCDRGPDYTTRLLEALRLVIRHRRGSICSEDTRLYSPATQLCQGIDKFAIIGRTAHIQIKTIFPRTALYRAAFDLEQVNSTTRKRLERAVQSTGLMREFDDD